MKAFGRIMLLIVSAFLIGLGIPAIVNYFTVGVQTGNWAWTVNTCIEWASVIIGGFGIAYGLIGKGTSVMVILSLALIGGYLVQIIINAVQHRYPDLNSVLIACKAFALPCLVLTSSLLMKKED